MTPDNVDRGGEGEIIDGGVVEHSRVFDIAGDWSTAALDPGVWINIVCERDPGL